MIKVWAWFTGETRGAIITRCAVGGIVIIVAANLASRAVGALLRGAGVASWAVVVIIAIVSAMLGNRIAAWFTDPVLRRRREEPSRFTEDDL